MRSTTVLNRGVHTSAMALLFVVCILMSMSSLSASAGSSYMVDPMLDCGTHDCFSWNYDELNESTGWWSHWYPACNSTVADSNNDNTAMDGLLESLSGVFVESDNVTSYPWQSPIDVTTADVVNASVGAVLGAWNSTPFTYEYMVASKQEMFNVVRCSFLDKRIMITLKWNLSETEGTVVSASEYQLIAINVRYPAEHLIDNYRADAEVQFTLYKSRNGSIKLANGTTVSDTLEKFVSVNVLVRAATLQTDVIDPIMQLALNKIAKGLDTGSMRFQMPIPKIDSAYTYVGSLSYPPCTAGMRYFVATDVRAMDVTTLQLIQGLYKNKHQYRAAQPLNGRTVQLVNFSVENMLPQFRTAPSPLMYRLNIQYPTFISNIWHYSMMFALSICVFFALIIIWLLVERFTYVFPYSVTWREPVGGREVYGVPTRYSSETGRARPMTIKQWAKSLLAKNQGAQQNTSEQMLRNTNMTRSRKMQ